MVKFVVGAVAVIVLFIGMLLGASGGGSTAAAACGAGAGDTAAVTKDLPKKVGTWDTDQVKMAARLVGAAHEVKANEQATTIVVMTAMGESSLTNLNHGDAVDNTTIGVLQQDDSYGERADRLNPEKAAKAFLAKLVKVPDWETLEPTIAAHKVQVNAAPYHYAKFWTDAQQMVAAVTGAATTSGCDVSGDQVELAKTLKAAWVKGTFTDAYHPQMVKQEILPIVDGTTKDGCQVDTRILQLLVAALNKYGSVQISDMNRPCVGIGTHCESGSLHCKNPAVAVDFNAVGGNVLLGSGKQDIEFLQWLDTVMPKGSQAGQVQCRPNTPLENFRQFEDPCSHQHIDLGSTTEPLTLGKDAS
ncbi:MAG: hypothetical protein K0S70_49 [Microbacterium sp.]|jgi:hypothetical protein|nr:hypothetical protein [Microbacterium sp.]